MWHPPTARPLTAANSCWHQVTPTYGWIIDSSQEQLAPSYTYLGLDHWQQPAAAVTKLHLPTAGPLTATSSSCHQMTPTYGRTIDSNQQKLSQSNTYLRQDHWRQPAAAVTMWHLPTAWPLTAASSSSHQVTPTYGSTIDRSHQVTFTYGWTVDSSSHQVTPTYGLTFDSSQQQLSQSDTYLRLDHWQQPAAAVTKWHLPTAGPLTAATTAVTKWHLPTAGPLTAASSSWHQLTPTYGWTIDSSQQQLSPSDTYLRLNHWQQPAAAGTKWHLPSVWPLIAASSSWHQVTPTSGWTIDSSQQQLAPSNTYLGLDHWQQPAAAGTKWHLPTAGPLTAASSSCHPVTPTCGCRAIDSIQQQLSPSDTYLRLDHWQQPAAAWKS